jgi:predicted NAD/FAD-dependent oxidoreductase
VLERLSQALATQLPAATDPRRAVRWHHAAVHRWRHAAPAADCDDSGVFWWDASLGLGVCGDSLGGGGVEAAWHSGDELADQMAASCEPSAPVLDTQSMPDAIRPSTRLTDAPVGVTAP